MRRAAPVVAFGLGFVAGTVVVGVVVERRISAFFALDPPRSWRDVPLFA